MALDCPYVSRGGLKLQAALREFEIDVSGRRCCDFGSHVGGFVDCLLQHGAASVDAVEPGYGVLDYKLRRDPRVVVHERTNALHFQTDSRFDLVTIDVGWTPQRRILPAARRLLHAAAVGVITLVKPQYEAPAEWLDHGTLGAAHANRVVEACCDEIAGSGWEIRGRCRSPVAGHAGNVEALLWLIPMNRPAGG